MPFCRPERRAKSDTLASLSPHLLTSGRIFNHLGLCPAQQGSCDSASFTVAVRTRPDWKWAFQTEPGVNFQAPFY